MATYLLLQLHCSFKVSYYLVFELISLLRFILIHFSFDGFRNTLKLLLTFLNLSLPLVIISYKHFLVLPTGYLGNFLLCYCQLFWLATSFQFSFLFPLFRQCVLCSSPCIKCLHSHIECSL